MKIYNIFLVISLIVMLAMICGMLSAEKLIMGTEPQSFLITKFSTQMTHVVALVLVDAKAYRSGFDVSSCLIAQ